jgi:hypothetical protein
MMLVMCVRYHIVKAYRKHRSVFPGITSLLLPLTLYKCIILIKVLVYVRLVGNTSILLVHL